MKRAVVSLVIMLMPLIVQAQLRVTLNVTARPSPYLSDWQSRTETVILTIVNSDTRAYDVKLGAKIFAGGALQAETKLDKVPTFTVRPGVNIFHGQDLVPESAVKFYGDINTTVVRSGRLPSGEYGFCIQVFDAATLAPLSAEQCGRFTIQSYQEPRLLAPADGTALPPPLTRLTLRWSDLTPKYSPRQQYQVNVMEVRRGQTPVQAFLANRPILDQNVTGVVQLIWPPNVQLDTAITYVWSVRGLDDAGNPLGETRDGWAQPWSFTLGRGGGDRVDRPDTIIIAKPDTLKNRRDSLVRRDTVRGTPVDTIAVNNDGGLRLDSLMRLDTTRAPRPDTPVRTDSLMTRNANVRDLIQKLRIDTGRPASPVPTMELISPIGELDSGKTSLEFAWKFSSNGARISEPRFRIRVAEYREGVDPGTLLAGSDALTLANNLREQRFVFTDMKRLKPGRPYVWDVVAFGADGQIYEVSPIRAWLLLRPYMFTGCIGMWPGPPAIKLCAASLPTTVALTPNSFPFGFCAGAQTYSMSCSGPMPIAPVTGPYSGGTVNVSLPAGAATGTYTFSITINQGTCSCTSQQTVVIYPSISITAAQSQICKGDANTLTLNGVMPYDIANLTWFYSVNGGAFQLFNTTGLTINTNALPDVSAFCTPGTLTVPVTFAALVTLPPANYPGPPPPGCGFASNPVINLAFTTFTVFCPPVAGTVTVTPATICTSASTATVTVTSAAGTGTRYWSIDGGSWNPGPATFTHTITVPGQHTFQTRWTNGTCPPTYSNLAIVRTEQPVTCTIVQSAFEVCPHDDAMLSLNCTPALSGHVVQWQYQINCTGAWINATTGPAQNTNPIGPISTNWNSVCWRAIITSISGICPPVTTAPVTIKVIQPPSVPTISANKVEKCPGMAVTITSTVPTPAASAPFTYTLYRDGLPVTTQVNNPVFTNIVNPGIYYIWVANKTRCDSTRSANVLNIRDCNIAITIKGPCCGITPGNPVTLTGQAQVDCPTTTMTWQWLPPLSGSGTGAITPPLTFTPPSPGPLPATLQYCIKYTYTLPNGSVCTGTGCIDILYCP